MKLTTRICIPLILALLTLSCSEGLTTIFDNIVNDNLITNNQLEDTISVPSMTKVGTSYYIAAGTVRTRAEAQGSPWSVITVGPGIHYSVASTGAALPLYAACVYDNGTGGLYSYNGTASLVAITDLQYVCDVKNSNSTVYASIKKTGANPFFSLYNVSGSSEVAWVAGLNLTTPIEDFTDNGSIYIVTDHFVYRDGTDITPNPAYEYTGVISSNGRIYLSTNNGYLYQSTNAAPGSGDWTASSAFTYTKGGNSYYVHFTKFAEIVFTTGPTYYLLVGSRSTGFYQIDTSAAFAPFRPDISSKPDLYNGSVEDFYVDPPTAADSPRVFFCTMGAGLWSNTCTYAASLSWSSTWTRE